MAALSNIPSIIIQASIDIKGRWDVLNPKAITLRDSNSCKGKGDMDCPMKIKCINTILPSKVIEIFEEIVIHS